MPIPVPAAPQRRLKDAAFCASLGCLCFIRRWFDLDILQVRGLDFYRSAPRDSGLMAATLLSCSLLALVFWLLAQWVRRAGNPRLSAVARCVTLLVVTYAIESMRRYWNSEFRLIDWTSNGVLIALEFALALGAGMAVVGNSRILHVARSVVLLGGWLIPVMLFDFFWGHPQAQPSAFQARGGLTPLPARPAAEGTRGPESCGCCLTNSISISLLTSGPRGCSSPNWIGCARNRWLPTGFCKPPTQL